MKILMINEVCGQGSTGKICCETAEQLSTEGHEVKIAYGRLAYVPTEYQKYGVRIGNDVSVHFHALQTCLFDMHGFGSRRATKKFLKWADEFAPDLLWLHNLHGYYINIDLLFHWIKQRPNLKVQWTLHDCWAFTGHCAHFTMIKCDKWKSECGRCPQRTGYPASILIDQSKRNYHRKKGLFCGISNMKLIVPSEWLAGLVKQSFLAEYPIEVRHNKVDETVFRPTKSNFRTKLGLNKKTVILGVASRWNTKKGLDDFIELSRMLDDNYAIVLVGLSEKQIKQLSGSVVGISKLLDGRELAAIYSDADIYVNASKEETFGMTTLEAIQCGTKTVVYDSTAGAEVARQYGGIAVPEGVENLYKAITGKDWIRGGISSKKAVIYAIPKTTSKDELAMIYSMADIFVNPTHEDTYPTTNLEAQACGTWVITYDVGGAAETLTCGQRKNQ